MDVKAALADFVQYKGKRNGALTEVLEVFDGLFGALLAWARP